MDQPPDPQLQTLLAALLGCEVHGWAGTEMAVRDHGPVGEPQFHDPNVRCLQLWPGALMSTDRGALSFTTRQLDTSWCLEARADRQVESAVSGGSFRTRRLPELPVGPLTAAALVFDDGMPAEALLTIGSSSLLLLAGEVEEGPGGTLTFVRGDESLLAFTRPLDADAITWRPRRDTPRWVPLAPVR